MPDTKKLCRFKTSIRETNVYCAGPETGYDQAAQIAKVAFETGCTVREVALEISGLTQVRIDELLDLRKQSGPPLT